MVKSTAIIVPPQLRSAREKNNRFAFDENWNGKVVEFYYFRLRFADAMGCRNELNQRPSIYSWTEEVYEHKLGALNSRPSLFELECSRHTGEMENMLYYNFPIRKMSNYLFI